MNRGSPGASRRPPNNKARPNLRERGIGRAEVDTETCGAHRTPASSFSGLGFSLPVPIQSMRIGVAM
jgi:hypothetical protein